MIGDLLFCLWSQLSLWAVRSLDFLSSWLMLCGFGLPLPLPVPLPLLTLIVIIWWI